MVVFDHFLFSLLHTTILAISEIRWFEFTVHKSHNPLINQDVFEQVELSKFHFVFTIWYKSSH